jgi:hypothetical protein
MQYHSNSVPKKSFMDTKIEELRLKEAKDEKIPWQKWGPYLSERQWGTVREDYSTDGNAWNYFTHDQSRSRAYRWGEDGLGGISDHKQYLCFAIALWNGEDAIIKERIFGLTNSEGNHGEDVKEYYFYLDSTPTHSYMKYLYKYPQAAYPYEELLKINQERGRDQAEYELLDTGIFDEDRYFDVFVEYAKNTPEDIYILISIANRSAEPAVLDLLPTLWFRNTWSWEENTSKPVLKKINNSAISVVAASHPELGDLYLSCQGKPALLFTENDTNTEQIFHTPNASPYVKDGINNYIVNGESTAVNPEQIGTKVAAHYHLEFQGGETKVIRLLLANTIADKDLFEDGFEQICQTRKAEADEFYTAIIPSSIDSDRQNVMRQALAGMLWTKQYYYFDISKWLTEHGVDPMSPSSEFYLRNHSWFHMVNSDIISMPDKWEYPWYAAWDLAFHTVALSIVDIDFAKHQLELMLDDLYLHPSGQIPAYEWNFGDVNPPVHAWATLYVYNNEKQLRGEGDIQFLRRAFRKLLLNFTWWINRKDPNGKNVFEGGFLGLDNIGVFDRSSPLPTGGSLEQADGTAWMALFSQNMLEIALELTDDDPDYEDMVLKFYQHFVRIAAAMDRIGEHEDEMWDEEDGFFYDLLCLPDGNAVRLKVRSMVGLLPLCASSVIQYHDTKEFADLMERAHEFLSRYPRLIENIASPDRPGVNNRRLFAILDETKLRRVLLRMLDENEFLSDYGIRSLSLYHAENPYNFIVGDTEYQVQYLPAESDSGMFGGNSNWRGPVWFPVNILLVRALLVLYSYYGDEFTVECPTGSGVQMNLYQISQEIGDRLTRIFIRNQEGSRPVYGQNDKFQNDPHWRDYILFYEYFHGDNGVGVGASHQTGWTGLIARLIQLFGADRSNQIIEEGAKATIGHQEEV